MSYYKNIEQIDRDIEILKLKNQIEEEKIKLRFHQVKEDLNPKTIVSDLISNATKSFSILKILTSFIGGRRRKSKGW